MNALLTVYLVGVVVAIIACAYGEAQSHNRSERNRPAHPVLLTALAGLVWPLLILGAAQFGALMVIERFLRRSSTEPVVLVDA